MPGWGRFLVQVKPSAASSRWDSVAISGGRRARRAVTEATDQSLFPPSPSAASGPGWVGGIFCTLSLDSWASS